MFAEVLQVCACVNLCLQKFCKSAPEQIYVCRSSASLRLRKFMFAEVLQGHLIDKKHKYIEALSLVHI